MKIAIIGSGISSLYAAYRLHQNPLVDQISVYEANAYIGGHTNTIDVTLDNRDYAVDTGFIVFNTRTYPHFLALLHELNVEYQASDMGFSVSDRKSGLEYCGSSLNALFCQRRNFFNPLFYKLLLHIVRFNKHAQYWLEHTDEALSLGEFLSRHHYYREFIDYYIVPMGAAIWSTPPKKMLDFPARTFIRFLKNHGLLTVTDQPQWYVIKGGSKEYVKRLIAPFKNSIHLNTRVQTIHRHATHVDVVTRHGSRQYDHVFIGAHSDQALRMLGDPSPAEREILGAIGYQLNQAILHTDSSLLPKKRRAWAAWNYSVLNTETTEQSVILTYSMNILQSIESPHEFCVTLNNSANINPKRILARIDYEHPVFDSAAIAAQQRWSEINGNNRTFYCGAYWGYGFHEDGINSAIRAIDLFSNRGMSDLNEKLYLQRMDQAPALSE